MYVRLGFVTYIYEFNDKFESNIKNLRFVVFGTSFLDVDES